MKNHDIMSESEQGGRLRTHGERRMAIMNEVHDIMSASEKGVLAHPASDELDRDVFCHDMTDGKLLQTNKKYSRLKQKREEAERQHPPEKVIFMNMCMLCDGDKVLALDKTGSDYSGTTFPGGHVEAGETFTEAVIREMKEETGLTIHHPVLKGIYHWYRDGFHNVGLLYRAESFEGELKSSEEGQVYWILREEYNLSEVPSGTADKRGDSPVHRL